MGTLLLTHHSRVLAGAGSAVVKKKGGTIVINITSKETTSKREVKHFPLSQTFGAALSCRDLAQVLRTGKNGADFSHALCSAANTGTLNAFISFRVKSLPFLVLHTLKHAAWTRGTACSQLLGWVFAMHYTPNL